MEPEKQIFNIGDKVYYPARSTKIYRLEKSRIYEYPFEVKEIDSSFTYEGKLYSCDEFPSIFHATFENCKKLSSLYSIQFEEPKLFLDIHLEKGSKVLCLIKKKPIEKLPEYVWELNHNTCIIDVISIIVTTGTGKAYISEQGIRYTSECQLYPIAIDSKGQITYLS